MVTALLLLVCGCGAAAPEKKVALLLPVDNSPAIAAAKILAADAIAAPDGKSRLPKFLTWPTRGEIGTRTACKDGTRAILKTTLFADFDSRVHFQFSTGSKDPTEHVRDNLGFYYNREAALRLCGPVTTASPKPTLYDGTVSQWIKDQKAAGRPVKSMIDGPFPKGSRAATAIWQVLKRNTAPTLETRTDRTVATIIVPEVLLSEQTVIGKNHCPMKLPREANNTTIQPRPGETPVALDQFYWVQLNNSDHIEGAKCGDIAVLVGFHLIEKVTENPPPGESGWLWATYWWSDRDKSRKHIEPPSNAAHHGAGAVQWSNYVIDATLRSEAPMINPWKEKPGSNCAFCHAFASFPNTETDKPDAKPLPTLPAGSMSADFIYAAAIQEKRAEQQRGDKRGKTGN